LTLRSFPPPAGLPLPFRPGFQQHATFFRINRLLSTANNRRASPTEPRPRCTLPTYETECAFPLKVPRPPTHPSLTLHSRTADLLGLPPPEDAGYRSMFAARRSGPSFSFGIDELLVSLSLEIWFFHIASAVIESVFAELLVHFEPLNVFA